MVGETRAWLGGFGELAKRKIYTWEKHEAITVYTYIWNKYNVIYGANVYNVTENGLNLFGLRIQPTLNTENVYYTPTSVSSTLNSTLHAFDVLDENHGTLKSMWEEIFSNKNTNGYKIYGTIQWTTDGPEDIVEESGYRFNVIYSTSSYWYITETSLKSTGIYNMREFTFNGNAIPYPYYGDYYVLGTMKEYGRTVSKGSLIGSVSSDTSSTYPENGISGGFYYEKDRTDTSYSKGSFIETVESTDPTAYPTDGHLNGYWYIKQTS